MKIRFKKLFAYVEQGERYDQAIIAFNRDPYLFKHEDMGNGMGRTYTAQYRYFLRIDLWFVDFTFSWKGIEKNHG